MVVLCSSHSRSCLKYWNLFLLNRNKYLCLKRRIVCLDHNYKINSSQYILFFLLGVRSNFIYIPPSSPDEWGMITAFSSFHMSPPLISLPHLFFVLFCFFPFLCVFIFIPATSSWFFLTLPVFIGGRKWFGRNRQTHILLTYKSVHRIQSTEQTYEKY